MSEEQVVGEKRSRNDDEIDAFFSYEDFVGDPSEEQVIEEEKSNNVTLCCEAHKDGSFCGLSPINMSIYANFGEKVCLICLRNDDKGPNCSYGLVSKTNAMKEYLITSELLEGLKFKRVLNPTNKNYAPLKLYLRKQVRELALSRYDNDPQKLEAERSKRELKKFERNVVKMNNIMAEQAEEFRNAVEEKSTIVLDVDSDANEASDQPPVAVAESSSSTWKAKKVFNKVKSPKLKDMIKCIRG